MISCPHCKAPQVYLHWYRCWGKEIVKCLRCGEYKEREARGYTPRKVVEACHKKKKISGAIGGQKTGWPQKSHVQTAAALNSAFNLLDVFNFQQFLDASRCSRCPALTFLDRQLRDGSLVRFKGPKGVYVYCRLARPGNRQEAING